MPAETATLDFRPVAEADFPRLRAWLREPHVARWWGESDGELAAIRAHMTSTTVQPFMVLVDGEPVGYIQSYDIHGETDHPYQDQPPGSYGIDLSIGDPALVGRGLGPRIVEAFVRRLFAGGVPRIVIDPHPDNRAAIRAYEKAGFRTVGPRTSIYGPALIMVRDASDQKSTS